MIRGTYGMRLLGYPSSPLPWPQRWDRRVGIVSPCPLFVVPSRACTLRNTSVRVMIMFLTGRLSKRYSDPGRASSFRQMLWPTQLSMNLTPVLAQHDDDATTVSVCGKHPDKRLLLSAKLQLFVVRVGAVDVRTGQGSCSASTRYAVRGHRFISTPAVVWCNP